MTIARRRPGTLGAIAPVPPASAPRPPAPETGVPLPLGDVPATDSVAPAGRLRRCTFRRIDRAEAQRGRTDDSSYEVMCLYGTDAPLPLGDIAAAQPVCEACTASGIFRPDED